MKNNLSDFQIKTVGDLVKELLKLPQNAKIFGTWEGVANPILEVKYDEKEFLVFLNVDMF